MTTPTERALASAASVPARKRRGRNLPAGQLTPRERRFVDALAAGAKSLREAWTTATGTRGPAAQVGGARALRRPEVAAALVDEAKRMRAVGALAGMRRLVHLVDRAKSEYVQADAAKYLASAEGLGPRADTKPGSGAPITINIDIGEPGSGTSRVQITGPHPQPADEQG